MHNCCVIIYMCCYFSTLKVKTPCVAVCVYIYAIPPGGPRPTLCCLDVYLRHFIGQNRHNKTKNRYLKQIQTYKLLFLLHFITDRVSVNVGYIEIIAYFRHHRRKRDSGCTKQNTTEKLKIYIYKEYKNTPPHQKRYKIPYP
jgi:hypothetical protein